MAAEVAVAGFANILTKLDKTAKSKPAADSDQKPKSFAAAVETARKLTRQSFDNFWDRNLYFCVSVGPRRLKLEESTRVSGELAETELAALLFLPQSCLGGRKGARAIRA